MDFKDLNDTIKSINKKYGMKIVKSGAEVEHTIKIPTREPKMDWILDGGYPLNRFIEFSGEPSSGKSRDAAIAIENFQHYCFNCHTFNLKAEWNVDNNGLPELESCKCTCGNPKTCVCSIIDIEGTIDFDFLSFFDIDINGIYLSRSESPSMTINLLEAFLRNPKVGLIIADGIGLQSSDAELENAAEDNKMNSGARVWNSAIRKWVAALNANTNLNGGTSPTTVILINRKYQTVGQMYNTDVIQGGGGLKHGKSISVNRKRNSSGEVYKDAKKKDVIIGFHRNLKVEKNKSGMPERKVEQFINLDPESELGYLRADINGEYVDLAIDLGLIEVRGGWYCFGDSKYQGRDKLKEAVGENLEIKRAVNKIIYKKEDLC